MMKVGLIGLGAMGLPMARNLAKSGFLTAIWNRTSGRATKLAEEIGVPIAQSPSELARTVDIILTCVSADADVLGVVKQMLPGITPNKIVVDFSTVSSETAKKAANILSAESAHFLDAPVSGGVEGAKNGTLAMMVGGDKAVLDKIRGVLEVLTSRIVHMGQVGTGQGTKAVNQVMAAGINQAVTEALAFGAAQGLAMDKVIDVISEGAASNWFLQHRGRTMMQDTFEPGFKLALHHKDLKICLGTAGQLGMSLPLTSATLGDYQTLMEKELGDEDISALYRLKRP